MSKYYIDMENLQKNVDDIKKIAKEQVDTKISDILKTFEAIEWSSLAKESYEESFRNKITKLKEINDKLNFYCYFLQTATDNYNDVNSSLEKKYEELSETIMANKTK